MVTKKPERVSLRRIKKMVSDTNVMNPKKIMDEIGGSETVVKLKEMGKAIDGAFNILQEQIIIVQKNQLAFQEYFKDFDKQLKELKKSVENDRK